MDERQSQSPKREASAEGGLEVEYPSDGSDEGSIETPGAKRRRIFGQLTESSPSPEPQSEAQTLANSLDERRLRRCYDIAKDALAAQFSDRKISPDVMGEFFELVFDGWHFFDAAPTAKPLDSFPLNAFRLSLDSPVGRILIGEQALLL